MATSRKKAVKRTKRVKEVVEIPKDLYAALPLATVKGSCSEVFLFVEDPDSDEGRKLLEDKFNSLKPKEKYNDATDEYEYFYEPVTIAVFKLTDRRIVNAKNAQSGRSSKLKNAL